MGTVFLADGKDMVTRERKTIAVGTLRDPDDPLPFHTRYYGDARRGIHPRHREKIGKVLTASSKAEQKGFLQPLGEKKAGAQPLSSSMTSIASRYRGSTVRSP